MLTAYLFDKRRGKEIQEWRDSIAGLSKNQVLWVDLLDPTEDEEQRCSSRLRTG